MIDIKIPKAYKPKYSPVTYESHTSPGTSSKKTRERNGKSYIDYVAESRDVSKYVSTSSRNNLKAVSNVGLKSGVNNISNTSSKVMSILKSRAPEMTRDVIKSPSSSKNYQNNWHLKKKTPKKTPKKSAEHVGSANRDRYHTMTSQNSEYQRDSKHSITGKSHEVFMKHLKTGLKRGEAFNSITRSDM